MAGNYNFKTKSGDYFSQTLTFREENGDLRDFSGATAKLTVYKPYSDVHLFQITTGSGITMGGVLGTIDITIAGANLSFPPSQYKYDLEVTYPGGQAPITELEGTFLITSTDGVMSIYDWVVTSSPLNLTIHTDFVTSRKMYWQQFLQYGTYPAIADEDIYVESAWPNLFNCLIGLMIVKDALDLLYKAAYITGTNSQQDSADESAGGASVKKIVTGPTEVEYHDPGRTLDSLFKSSGSGLSAYDSLNGDICGLGSRLEVKLPGCKGNRIAPTLLKKAGVTEPESSDLVYLLNKYM